MDNDQVSLTKLPKKLGVHQIMFGECLTEMGRSMTKENLPKRTPEKAVDPTVKSLVGSSCLDACSAITTVQAGMDDESYFLNNDFWKIF